MRIVSSSQMAAIDAETISCIGIDGQALMESAGREVFKAVKKIFPNRKSRFLVLCGPGNNGGDGFVIARCLKEAGYDTTCFAAGSPEKLNKNAFVYERLYGSFFSADDLDNLKVCAQRSSCVIDALFGTGLKRPLKDIFAEIVNCINEIDVPVLAVDIPSGIDGDSGRILGCAFKCSWTVTIGLPKWGLFLGQGREHAGMIKIADIGFPASVSSVHDLSCDQLITKRLCASLLPERPRNSHKGTFGTVWVLGGSAVYCGAPVFSASAVLRSGAGLSVLAAPDSVVGKLGAAHPEIMRCRIGRSGSDFFCSEDLSQLSLKVKGLEKCPACPEESEEYFSAVSMPSPKVLCLGPGMARKNKSTDFVSNLYKNAECIVIADADALWHLSAACSAGEDFSECSKDKIRIITPHLGELAVLMGVSVQEISSDLTGWAKKCALKFGCTAVVKGAPTVISDGTKCWINISGGPILSQGGSGDVLAGLISGLCAQGTEPFAAAALGCFMHGYAADLIGKKYGHRGIFPEEICGIIPRICGILYKMRSCI